MVVAILGFKVSRLRCEDGEGLSRFGLCGSRLGFVIHGVWWLLAGFCLQVRSPSLLARVRILRGWGFVVVLRLCYQNRQKWIIYYENRQIQFKI
ncbi:hypothetical protein VIGAN_03017000 [Vigna angularis var. angularis]|uniref:Uncharacterized protein n=1 Tax=Vigna angularis var. angularis TaxID=157739 RepID=A0A0S3RIY9_PHAAN|nr:hypothetical protein VIGAN_03017000 [Vigna angularis var. angularis]